MASTSPFYGLQFDSDGTLPFTPMLRALYRDTQFEGYGPGRVYTDRTGSYAADAFWADIEPGAIWPPSKFGPWLDQRRAATGQPGGAYCNRANLPAVIEAAATRPWSLWLATLDGTADPAAITELAALPAGVSLLVVQAFPSTMIGGINADISVVVDQHYWDSRHD